jgi:hypothetical protein
MWKKYLPKRLAGSLRDTIEGDTLEIHHPLFIITEKVLKDLVDEINSEREAPKLEYKGLTRVENLIYDINKKESDKSLFLEIKLKHRNGLEKSIYIRPKGWQDHIEDYLPGVILSLRLKFKNGKIVLRNSIANAKDTVGILLISDYGVTKTGWSETIKRRIENVGCKVVLISDIMNKRDEIKEWLKSLD